MTYFLEIENLCNSNNGMKLFSFIGNIYNIIKIVIPILIVLFGSIDLLKAVTSQKSDEMKKSISLFIKRLIMGVCVFFVFPLLSLVLEMAGQNDNMKNKCMDCFLNPNNTSICNYTQDESNKIKVDNSAIADSECMNSTDKNLCCSNKYGSEDSTGIWVWDDLIGCQNTTAQNPDN